MSKRTSAQYREHNQYGTIAVYTRNHINGCKLTDPNQNNCSCPKWIYANRKGETPRRYAAETPSFPEACDKAKREIDGWNPEIARARAAAAKQERHKREIADVVNDFIEDRATNGGTESTAEQWKSLLGYIDPKTNKMRGHFLAWVDERNAGLAEEERMSHFHELDTSLLGQFKVWLMRRYTSDYSRNQRWGMMRTFFRWAHERGLTDNNAAEPIKAPPKRKGNRCGAWTEQQYRDIIAAIPRFANTIENQPKRNLPIIEARLRLFAELMRYTGMALVDATLFCPFIDNHGLGLDDRGVLRYRRKKTGELAVVPIENQQLLVAIRAGIPMEDDSDPRRPFAPKGLNVESKEAVDAATRRWSHRLDRAYEIAGITQVVTEVGTKAPHAHMFRDTFAKWHLDRGTDIRDLQKMLGHSSVLTTERNYASWMKDDQDAMIARIRSRVGGTNVVSMPSRHAHSAAASN